MSSTNIALGEIARDTIDYDGDYKTFSVNLISGIEYAFYAEGITLKDPYLTLTNSSSEILKTDDDIDYKGSSLKWSSDSLNSLIYYTPSYS